MCGSARNLFVSAQFYIRLLAQQERGRYSKLTKVGFFLKKQNGLSSFTQAI